MTFKSGAAFLSILTLLSFLIRSISCNMERSLFKKLLKMRYKDDNHEVARKPIYIKGRQEEQKATLDDYTQNNSEFYNELRSDLRENLKNLFKYESTKNERRDSATQQKEEEKLKDKRMLRGPLRMRPKYDLKSLLRREKKRTETRLFKYPQKLSYEELEMEDIIKPGKNDYKIVEGGRIHQPLENSHETVEIGQIAEPDEEDYEIVEIGQIAEPDEEDYEIVEIGQIEEPEEEKGKEKKAEKETEKKAEKETEKKAEKETEKKAEKETAKETEKEAEKADTPSQLLNPFNFEDIITKEWKELDDIDNRSWSDITNSCQIALSYGLDSNPNRYSKMEMWRNKHKTFSFMRYAKNRTDRRNLDDFMSRLRKLKGGKRYEESWKEESEKWEVIKYLKKKSDENWYKNLKQSWVHWFRREIPEANFDMFI
ncbi:hypothetical protein PCYB_051130 [Plasmodium cynomolgi strain B]|uniref:Phist protein n=1 Tax=Plasmodium cynomolgi (strain B) TaxID=1120755 RepID=K6USV9_PLACD|nr:hypothetical protein PCYB_051130 [Plasmodium cynomolgi strain B]GAB65095.1 hypothetical protein PCYB_051130 [Plasmodium cynomolgi strain B]